MQSPEKGQAMTTLANKIDRLFETCRRPDGKPYSYEDVEQGTNGAITGTYVWKLRTGKAKNPGYKALAALSQFFDVPVTYFFSEEPVSEVEYREDMELARSLRRAGVKQIALRVCDLDEDAKADILSMIRYVRQARGLNEPDENTPRDPE
jgi:transcriptional regulator with XRE-family HTH domain